MYIYCEFHVIAAARVLRTCHANWIIKQNYCHIFCHFVVCLECQAMILYRSPVLRDRLLLKFRFHRSYMVDHVSVPRCVFRSNCLFFRVKNISRDNQVWVICLHFLHVSMHV